MNYWEKLRDPRWQRRRLEIMQRDDFTCQSCFASDQPLNVHHIVYRKGLEPWEYCDAELRTLCESCHKGCHEVQREVLLLLSQCEAMNDVRVALQRIIYRWEESDPKVSNMDLMPSSAAFWWTCCAKYPDLIEEARRRSIIEAAERREQRTQEGNS